MVCFWLVRNQGVQAIFNLIKNRKIFVPSFILGLCGSVFVIYSAHNFLSYTEKHRDKFDIPMAVKFEKTDFNSALAKAKTENKYVFIDFYTAWCGPCLKFTQNILTDEEVGNAMNASFINLKYDAEKGEGKTLAKKYDVHSYPTLLILDADGKVIENLVDEYLPRKETMIEVAKKYMNHLE